MPETEPIVAAAPPTKPKATTVLGGTRCCGTYEMDNLSASLTPADALWNLKSWLNTPYGNMFAKAFIVFTGVVKMCQQKQDAHYVSQPHPTFRTDNYGQAFADFLEANSLGKVTGSSEKVNPASGNLMKVWIWEPDYPALVKYYAKLPAPTPNVDPNLAQAGQNSNG